MVAMAARFAGKCRRCGRPIQPGTQMEWTKAGGALQVYKDGQPAFAGVLTDDDIAQINGNREQLEGKIQARYGQAKDQVKKDVDNWLNRI